MAKDTPLRAVLKLKHYFCNSPTMAQTFNKYTLLKVEYTYAFFTILVPFIYDNNTAASILFYIVGKKTKGHIISL